MKRCALALILLAVVFCVVGCSKGNSLPVVTGTVTLDGAPLAEGSIGFLDEKGGSYDGAIKDGAYTVNAPAGAKKVRVISNKEVGRIETEEGSDPEYEQIIPAKYNTETELTFTVPEKGGEANFDLTSN